MTLTEVSCALIIPNDAKSIVNTASKPYDSGDLATVGWVSVRSHQSHLKTTWALVDAREAQERGPSNC